MANKCKYYKRQQLVSYDGGQTWTPTGVYFKGSLIEASSSDCPPDTMFTASYIGGQTYTAECTSSTVLTSATTKPSGCEYTAMTEAIIGGCINVIDNEAFYDCTSLSAVTIPNSVTGISYGAFSECGLKSVTIPNSVVSIGEVAFDGCSTLSSVTIGNSVQEIKGRAFKNCSNLATITIPQSVTSIEVQCFRACSNLSNVTVLATTPPALGSSVFEYTSESLVIHVPAASVNAYKTAEGWSDYASIIQSIS